jgi:hypothetical protein
MVPEQETGDVQEQVERHAPCPSSHWLCCACAGFFFFFFIYSCLKSEFDMTHDNL